MLETAAMITADTDRGRAIRRATGVRLLRGRDHQFDAERWSGPAARYCRPNPYS